MLKSNKGITLIALIITILILLILSVVSISAVRNSSIFGNTKKAVSELDEVQITEDIEIIYMKHKELGDMDDNGIILLIQKIAQRDWCKIAFLDNNSNSIIIQDNNNRYYRLSLETGVTNFEIDDPTSSFEKSSITINVLDIPNAIITITSNSSRNNAYGTGTVSLEDYTGSIITYTVEAEGYEKINETIMLNKDEIIEPKLSKIKINININVPSKVHISINMHSEPGKPISGFNDKLRAITVDYGETITYWLELTNGYAGNTIYESITQTVENIKESFEITCKLEDFVLKHYYVKINPYPEDSKVTITDQNGNIIENGGKVEHGTKINWIVEKEHYESQSGSEEVTAEINKIINLEGKKHTIVINPSEADANVTITDSLTGYKYVNNATGRQSVTISYGTEIDYTITKYGYKTITQKNKIVTGDEEINIQMYKAWEVSIFSWSSARIEIKKKDGTIYTGEDYLSVEIEEGETITWTVSKDHYKTQTGEVIVNENINLEITLERIYVTFAETFNFTSCTNSSYNGLLNGGSTTVDGEIVVGSNYKNRDMGYFNISSSDITSKIPEDSNISKITVYYTLSREKKGTLAEAAGPQCKIVCDIYTGSTSKGSHTSDAASTSAQQKSYSVTNISRSELKNNGMKVDLKSSIKTAVAVKTYVSGLHVVIEGTKPET